MDREFNGMILKIAGERTIRELYDYARARPILLPPIIKEIDMRVMEELWKQNRSKHYIARTIGKSVRTVERWIEFFRQFSK